MIQVILYYLILPFFAASLVLKFIKKHGKIPVPPEIERLYREIPIEKKWFRTLRRDAQGRLLHLGDFETHVEAVDRAYLGKEEAVKAREKAAFLVLNDKAEVLEEVDS
jgi:hypothetical protein